jgi:8-oxo-dGTP pyrophosphatase MutT (NUDIX family)
MYGGHRWHVLSKMPVYESPWVSLWRADVEMPDGTLVEGHHVVEFPRPAVGVVPVGPDGRVLLVEHHRFVTDSTGWEVVCGRVDAGESPVETARRELAEEVGAAAAEVREVRRYYPASGTCRLEFVVCEARGVVLDGRGAGPREVGAVRWFTRAEVEALVDDGRVTQGLSLTALLLFLRGRAHG